MLFSIYIVEIVIGMRKRTKKWQGVVHYKKPTIKRLANLISVLSVGAQTQNGGKLVVVLIIYLQFTRNIISWS